MGITKFAKRVNVSQSFKVRTLQDLVKVISLYYLAFFIWITGHIFMYNTEYYFYTRSHSPD